MASVSIAAGQQTPGSQQPPAPTTPATPDQPLPGPGEPRPAPAEEPAPPPTEIPAAERPVPIPEDLVPAESFGVTVPRITLGGPDLFYPPAPRGRLQITPSLTLSGEFNDNVGARETGRRSDFIGALSPGITLTAQQPQYRIFAGYNTSAEFYARDSDRNEIGKRHRLFGDVFYRSSPRLTFTVTERFIFDRNTDLVTASGVSTGRRDAYRNTITPGLRYQATPLTALRMNASYTLLRFDESEDVVSGAEDSDTYRVSLGAERVFTPRLLGTADFGFAYFNIEDEPEAYTYTPRVGLEYQITQTMRGRISAGPNILQQDGDVEVLPAVTVGLEKAYRWGRVLAGYDRAITADGIGITDRHSVLGIVSVRTLARGLVVEFTPRYTMAEVQRDSDREVQALSLNLRAVYRIARGFSLVGSYTFFHQTSDRGFIEYDQNRVFLGLQYAYPISFD